MILTYIRQKTFFSSEIHVPRVYQELVDQLAKNVNEHGKMQLNMSTWEGMHL